MWSIRWWQAARVRTWDWDACSHRKAAGGTREQRGHQRPSVSRRDPTTAGVPRLPQNERGAARAASDRVTLVARAHYAIDWNRDSGNTC